MEETKLEGILEEITSRTVKKHTFLGITYRTETITALIIATQNGKKAINFPGQILDSSIGSEVSYFQDSTGKEQLLFDRDHSILYC